MKALRIFLFCFFSAVLISCEGQVQTTAEVPAQVATPETFAKYWYGGVAEINHYDLQQSRYGEVRKGDAVLVFVTEDFLPEKQVKKEFGDLKSVSVLKLNFMKKFITGIYDYSIMTSIFTPVAYMKSPATLKVSFTSQDWCGQAFSQMNMRNREMEFELRSYFQAEGDTTVKIPATYMEDDIWTRIRLEPQALPLGKIDMVPSAEYLRLHHKPIQTYAAEANLVIQVNDVKKGGEFYVYTLRFPELDRMVKIECASRFPFRITSWEETIGIESGKPQTTKATLTKTMMEPYWQMNQNSNQSSRDSLGMRFGMDR